MTSFFANIRGRIATPWLALQPWQRTHVLVLMAALVGFLAHYIILFCWIQPWYIEDSAISFAYARHFAEGDGLVPYVGGERVEGYSNPLWTFLIAVGWLLRVQPWTTSKVLGAFFGCAAMLASYGIVRYARNQKDGDWVPLLAPWMLAASSQFVIWSTSGLENALFCAMLACGMWALCREIEQDRKFPLSALFFFCLSITRPDGVAYAGIALVARVGASIVYRQWLATPIWIAVFGLPFGLYQYVRYSYFGWPWPNTWYAKGKDFRPFNWGGTAWNQVKEYYTKYGIVYALPLLVFGVGSFRGWRRWLHIASLALLAVFLFWNGRQGIPAGVHNVALDWITRHWVECRVWYILGAAIVLGLTTFGSPGWTARGMLWAAYAAGICFSIIASGDWMKAYRWFSLTSVPQFALLAVGIGEFVDALPAAQRRLFGRVPVRLVYALIPTLGLMGANAPRSWDFLNHPETSPRDVHKRVNYMQWVQSRLELEHVVLFDVDMGAHTWYTDWEITDIAGLIDLPMARHQKFPKNFLEEYIFDERRPDFAHVHGAWANKMKITKIPRWKEDYIEIPGFPSGGRGLHVGNHVRKDILVHRSAPRAEPLKVQFGGGVTMEDWQVPAPTVAPGGELWIASSWRAPDREDGFRVVVFFADDQGVEWSAEVEPGYDWYDNEYWQAWDYVDGRWSIDVPDKLRRGNYRVGIVVLDEATGAVLPFEPTEAAPAAGAAPNTSPNAAPNGSPAPTPATPVYMAGEWLSPDVVLVADREATHQKAEPAFKAAQTAAAAGDCETAYERWRDAVHMTVNDWDWFDDHVTLQKAARVGCLVHRAEGIEDLVARAEVYREARRIDPRNAQLIASGAGAAGPLETQGAAAQEKGDWEGAFTAYRAAVWSDPTRVLARKKAEEARNHRLGLTEEDVEKKVPGDPAKPAKRAKNVVKAPKSVAADGAPADPAVPGADIDPASPDGEPATPNASPTPSDAAPTLPVRPAPAPKPAAATSDPS